MTEQTAANSGKRHFGFVGLGNMGLPMACRLLEAGHELTVWNRSPGKTAELVRQGARAAPTPAAVLAVADVVGVCVKDGSAVESVVRGAQGFEQAGERARGKLVIDFSTIEPERTRMLALRLRESCGAAWLDAPVSGGVPGAVEGSLISFVGGEVADLERARPFLACVTGRVSYMGSAGAGQATKICNQMIVAVNVLTLAETYAFARRAGVAVEQLAPALAGGFADSLPLQLFGPGMAAHCFEPTRSAAALMAKDLGIARTMAAQHGADIPVAAFCSELYERVRARHPGMLDEDVSGLVRLYEPSPEPR